MRAIVAAAALAAIVLALTRLLGQTAPLTVETTEVDETPATIYRPASGGPAPVVVIAHGFAGSRQLMQPFAITLARNGYLAVTFDFRGHGRNPRPLTGDVTEVEGATRTLVAELERVARFARNLDQSDGRLAVLGHSMASDIVIRYAQAHDVAATVAVSMFAPSLEPSSPRNLLVVVGGLEAGMLKQAAREGVAMVPSAPAPEAVVEGKTYGRHADGSARRMVLADGVEHIGVLYSPEALAAASAWLNATFDRTGNGFVANRGPWIALLLAGIVALAWAGAALLPRVASPSSGGGRPWRRSWPVALVPAIATPLILRLVPTDFLPVLVADYLAAHFAVYGLLTAAMMAWLGWRDPSATAPERVSYRAFGAAAVLVTGFGLASVGLALDHFVMAFWPTAQRGAVLAVMLAGTLPWALADEWLTRGPAAARGIYPSTKVLMLASLGLAVALDPQLFFLVIIAPAMVAVFVIFGLFSRWSHHWTGHPLVAGVANALILAWALAVTFPLLGT